MRKKPPVLGKLILKLLLNHNHPDEIMGDYEEFFHAIVMDANVLKAKLWYWGGTDCCSQFCYSFF